MSPGKIIHRLIKKRQSRRFRDSSLGSSHEPSPGCSRWPESEDANTDSDQTDVETDGVAEGEGGDKSYDVDKVLGGKIEEGRLVYLIQWKNWAGEPTWELAENCNCEAKIREFFNKLHTWSLTAAAGDKDKVKKNLGEKKSRHQSWTARKKGITPGRRPVDLTASSSRVKRYI